MATIEKKDLHVKINAMSVISNKIDNIKTEIIKAFFVFQTEHLRFVSNNVHLGLG